MLYKCFWTCQFEIWDGEGDLVGFTSTVVYYLHLYLYLEGSVNILPKEIKFYLIAISTHRGFYMQCVVTVVIIFVQYV